MKNVTIDRFSDAAPQNYLGSMRTITIQPSTEPTVIVISEDVS